jgi:hypothetical protein
MELHYAQLDDPVRFVSDAFRRHEQPGGDSTVDDNNGVDGCHCVCVLVEFGARSWLFGVSCLVPI